MSVGQELLDVPLPSMVAKMSQGIAEGQQALDEHSVKVAEELGNKKVDVIPQITRTIAADGSVTYKQAEPESMSLLQVGLEPTFYQFSEATISVEMDIKTKVSNEESAKTTAEGSVDYGVWSASISAEAEWSRQTSKEVHGTSKLETKMVPKSPPPRLIPEVDTVDNRTHDDDD